MDNNDIRKEDLESVSGGECTVGPGNLSLQCPNCKSYNCAPVLSERYGPFNKVKVVCADCNHRWEMMVPLFDNAQ